MNASGKEALSEAELSELVELLRSLIRIRSVNPPGDEIVAARFLEQVLADEGLATTVVEPYPGRGCILARVRGDGTGGDPLLLLSHLDVVPADPAGWSHDPFGGDLADGYVWGRGALDMKGMVAMEVQVMRRIARSARAAGLDPARDPIPGLRRDVIFCSAADEEAGGFLGANWIVDEHPDWLRAAAAINEAGGFSMTYAGVRFYPIQVAEKGLAVYKIHVKGRWGHGSVPTPDNAILLAAQIVTRLADPGPARLTSAVIGTIARAVPHLTARAASALMSLASANAASETDGERGVYEDRGAVGESGRAVAAGADEPGVGAGPDRARIEATLNDLCDPVLARTVSAMVHDTVSVGVIHAGLKYNVVPGAAEIEIDCRTLPGTDEPAMLAELRRRIGEDLWARIEIDCIAVGAAVQAPLDGPLYPLLEQVVRVHDPQGVPVPYIAPFATDAKHLARIGVPVYGFSPLKLGKGEGLLDLMHGTDERVSVEALRFGLPVLWDVVTRFCS